MPKCKQCSNVFEQIAAGNKVFCSEKCRSRAAKAKRAVICLSRGICVACFKPNPKGTFLCAQCTVNKNVLREMRRSKEDREDKHD